MGSNDYLFLLIPGIRIENNRNKEDVACVDDIRFSGVQSDNGYPKVKSREQPFDYLYWKKGDKYQDFYIAGG